MAAHASASSARKRDCETKPSAAAGKAKAPRVKYYKSIVFAHAYSAWLAGKGLPHVDLAYASMRSVMDYTD